MRIEQRPGRLTVEELRAVEAALPLRVYVSHPGSAVDALARTLIERQVDDVLARRRQHEQNTGERRGAAPGRRGR